MRQSQHRFRRRLVRPVFASQRRIEAQTEFCQHRLDRLARVARQQAELDAARPQRVEQLRCAGLQRGVHGGVFLDAVQDVLQPPPLGVVHGLQMVHDVAYHHAQLTPQRLEINVRFRQRPVHVEDDAANHVSWGLGVLTGCVWAIHPPPSIRSPS